MTELGYVTASRNTQLSFDMGRAYSNTLSLSTLLSATLAGFGVVGFYQLRKAAGSQTFWEFPFPGHHAKSLARGVLTGLGLYALGFAYSWCIKSLLGHEPPSPWTSTKGLSPAGKIALLVLGGIGAPLAEEAFFRGYVFGSLERAGYACTGLILSAVLFASMHITDFFDVPMIGIFGLTLAWIYRRERSLLAPIAFVGIFSFGYLATTFSTNASSGFDVRFVTLQTALQFLGNNPLRWIFGVGTISPTSRDSLIAYFHHFFFLDDITWLGIVFEYGIFGALLIALPLLASTNHALAVFDAFYRSGALVFGGGHVVLPLLHDAVVSKGWVSQDVFLAGYGAAQAVPGPLFTFAAFLGSALNTPPDNLAGAALALVAIFLPGLLILLGALPFWDEFRKRMGAQAMMRGVNAAVVGILGAALYNPLWTTAILAPRDFALALAGFLALTMWKAPPWTVVAGTVIAAIALSSIG